MSMPTKCHKLLIGPPKGTRSETFESLRAVANSSGSWPITFRLLGEQAICKGGTLISNVVFVFRSSPVLHNAILVVSGGRHKLEWDEYQAVGGCDSKSPLLLKVKTKTARFPARDRSFPSARR